MDLTLVSWPMLLLALFVFGFAPGLMLRLIVLAYARDDPRRHELRGELYHVPRFERPFWVMEQLELALVEGLSPRIAWAATGRIIHRWHLGSGVRRHRKHPDTFWIPSEEERGAVVSGMEVKLTFEMRDGWCERMWVTVIGRKGRKLIGRLDNEPVGIPRLLGGDVIKFKRDHIIDIWYAHEGQAKICPGDGTPEHPDSMITLEARNGHDKHHQVADDGQFGQLEGLDSAATHEASNGHDKRHEVGADGHRQQPEPPTSLPPSSC